MDSDDPQLETPRAKYSRRRKFAWAAVAALLLMLGLSLRWALQPSQLGGLIVDRVGAALDLQISVDAIEYNLAASNPEIVVHGVVARQTGAEQPLLRAQRIYLSVPWSTILERGARPTVRRVEIEAPVLDLGALQRWRSSRPASRPVRIPTLVDGLYVTRASMLGDQWSIDRIELGLSELYPGEPLRASVHGRFLNDAVQAPFNLHVALTRPAFGASLDALGSVRVHAGDWRMPMQVKVSGRLRDSGDGFALDDFRAGTQARYIGVETEQPFVAGIAGSLRYEAGQLKIDPLGVVAHDGDAMPELAARGTLAWRDALQLRLTGSLAGWPDVWPTLPAPLGAGDQPIAFALDYQGPANLSGTTALRIQRDATALKLRSRAPQLQDWLASLATGTPLPPLDGSFTTPRLEIAGATLEGVEVKFDCAGCIDSPGARQADQATGARRERR